MVVAGGALHGYLIVRFCKCLAKIPIEVFIVTNELGAHSQIKRALEFVLSIATQQIDYFVVVNFENTQLNFESPVILLIQDDGIC